MKFLSFIIIAVFDFIICVTEIPKMLKQKLIRELVTFIILMLLGTAIGVMNSWDIKIPSPSDMILRLYEPISDLMKSLIKP